MEKGYKAVSVSIPHVESFSLHTSDYASTTDSSTSSQFDAGEPIQINEGDDIIVNHSSELPYRLIENLGHGYSATVEKVEDTWTGCVYARKVFRIHGGHNKRRQVYENEVRIIRRLDPHHHVIQVFATYMAKRELGLMLTPVADSGDLGTFLEDFLDEMPRDSRKIRIINMAFGCLSSGLAFLHKQKGRHKDIKPGNILIHQETVVYTDFGYSFDYSSQNQSTTDGRPDSFTRKYCAPEVEDWAPRNSKSDIYSLGCVFLEMYASLDARVYLPERSVAYHEATKDIFRSLKRLDDSNLNIPSLIKMMMDPHPQDRCNAEEALTAIWRRNIWGFCDICSHNLRFDMKSIDLDSKVRTGNSGSISRVFASDKISEGYTTERIEKWLAYASGEHPTDMHDDETDSQTSEGDAWFFGLGKNNISPCSERCHEQRSGTLPQRTPSFHTL